MKNAKHHEVVWTLKFIGVLQSAPAKGERGSFVFKLPANARVELIDLSNNASVWTTSRKLKSLKFKR